MAEEKARTRRRARPKVDEDVARAMLAALDRRLTRYGFRLREVRFRRAEGLGMPDITLTYDEDGE